MDEELMNALKTLCSAVNLLLRQVHSADREELVGAIFGDLCRWCGGDYPCYCRRDD